MQHSPTRPREYFTKPSDLGLAIEFIAIKRLCVFSQKMSKLGVKKLLINTQSLEESYKNAHTHTLYIYISLIICKP